MGSEVSSERSRKGWACRLSILLIPIGLGLSVLIGLGLAVVREEKVEEVRVPLPLSLASVQDDWKKARELLQPRDWESAAGRKKMRATQSWVEGSLGLHNAGFAVQRSESRAYEGLLWVVSWVEWGGLERVLPGRGDEPRVVWVAVPLADRGGGLVSALALARGAEEREDCRVRLLFYPPAFAVEELVEWVSRGKGPKVDRLYELMEEEGRIGLREVKAGGRREPWRVWWEVGEEGAQKVLERVGSLLRGV